MVNTFRARVDQWREDSYPGVTIVTRKLLEHWHDKAVRHIRPIFANWRRLRRRSGGSKGRQPISKTQKAQLRVPEQVAGQMPDRRRQPGGGGRAAVHLHLARSVAVEICADDQCHREGERGVPAADQPGPCRPQACPCFGGRSWPPDGSGCERSTAGRPFPGWPGPSPQISPPERTKPRAPGECAVSEFPPNSRHDVAMFRRLHRSKDIGEALREPGMMGGLSLSGPVLGIAWSLIRCPNSDSDYRCGEFCQMGVRSTPRNPGRFARRLESTAPGCTRPENTDNVTQEDERGGGNRIRTAFRPS